jgi:hypothetical protein
MAAPVGEAAPAAWDLRVGGAGTDEANGFYKQDGELNGKPKYTKVRVLACMGLQCADSPAIAD